MVRNFCIQKVLSHTMYMCKAVAPMLICALMERAGFLTAFLVFECAALYTVSFTSDRGARKLSFVRVHLYFKNVHDQQLRLCKITALFPGKPPRT